MNNNPYIPNHVEFIPVPILIEVYSFEFSMTAFDNSNISNEDLAKEIEDHLTAKGFVVTCCELALDFGSLFLDIVNHVVTYDYFTKPNNEECMIVHIKFKAKEVQVNQVVKSELQELKEAMQ
jgi:hypothetical protein